MKRTLAAGFTLIELMVSIAIIAVLAAIAIPLYQGHVAEARFQTAIQDIRQAELIMDDLALDQSLQAIEPSGYSGASVLGVYQSGSGLVVANASSTPSGTTPWLDPWGRIYRYQRPATRTDTGGNVSNDSAMPQGYDLFSQGPDNSVNTDDVMRGCNGQYVGMASGLPSC